MTERQRLLHNITEVMKGFVDYCSPTPKDVNFEIYDSTGNLQTYTYSNIKKQIEANKFVQISDMTLSGSVAGGEYNRIYEHTVQKEGFYFLGFNFTPQSDADINAVVVVSNFGKSYAYGGFYNGSAISGIKFLEAGEKIYIDMYGGNNNDWVIHYANLTVVQLFS